MSTNHTSCLSSNNSTYQSVTWSCDYYDILSELFVSLSYNVSLSLCDFQSYSVRVRVSFCNINGIVTHILLSSFLSKDLFLLPSLFHFFFLLLNHCVPKPDPVIFIAYFTLFCSMLNYFHFISISQNKQTNPYPRLGQKTPDFYDMVQIMSVKRGRARTITSYITI